MNLIEKLSKGLSKTRERMAATFATVFGGGAEAARELELMEEYLLLADVGPVATAKILAAAAENRRTVGLLPAVRNELLRLLSFNVRDDKRSKFFAGVNGTGKTTTVGKLAHFFRQQGKNVFVIGADTFRAAAISNWKSGAAGPIRRFLRASLVATLLRWFSTGYIPTWPAPPIMYCATRQAVCMSTRT